MLKKIFDFYINSSTHVALAIVSFTLLTYLDLEIEIDLNLIFFVFLSSVSAYNFVKYAIIASFERVYMSKRLKLIQIYSFIVFLFLIYSLFMLKLATIFVVVAIVLMTLLYTLPIFPGFNNLRDFKGLKIFIIALVWVFCTVLLPLVESSLKLEINLALITYLIIRFLWVLILLIPFEIRDLKTDAKHLNTLPQLIGVKGAKLIGVSFIVISFVLFEVFHPAYQQSAFFIMGVLSLILLILSNENRSVYFTSFIVESLPIMWVLIYLII